jgi:hypothetical protein
VLSSQAVSEIYSHFNRKVEGQSELEVARPFQEYYHEHMNMVGEKAVVEIYKRFQNKSSAAIEAMDDMVSELEEPNFAAKEPLASVELLRPFHQMSSVGTWLKQRVAPNPIYKTSGQRMDVFALDLSKDVAASSSPFLHLPSVGTWTTPRLSPKVHISPVQQDFDSAAPMVNYSSSVVHHLPSVGTWLTPRCVQQHVPATHEQSESPKEVAISEVPPPIVFRKLASVGTWLAPHCVPRCRTAYMEEQNFEFQECVSSLAPELTNDGSDFAFEAGYDFEGDDEVEIDVDDVSGEVCIVLDGAAVDFVRVEII